MPVPTVPRFEDPAFAIDTRSPATEPEWGVAPLLDFGNPNGQILQFNGSGEFIFANPATTLEQLIVKAMITQRLIFPAYDKEFGSDFWVIIGRGLSDLTIQSLSERYVRETLSNIDLIRSIDQIQTQIVGDTLYISFRVVAVTGHEKEFSFAQVVK